MTVYKGFLKVLNKCKGIIILYTAILLFFGAFSLQTSDDNNISFENVKPSIAIINYDENKGVTKSLIKYIEKNSELKSIENDKDKINDALFYRDVSYVIFIPKNYRDDFLNGKNPKIEIKKTGDYNSSYANMLLEKYLKAANIYQREITNEDDLILKINETLNDNVNVNVTEKQSKTSLEKATYYYNFANYSMLAGTIYVICLILSNFNDKNIKRRTVISSMDYKKYNRILILSSMLFAVALWLLYVILSFIFIKDAMVSLNGIYYIINSFIFTICTISIAFLISSLVKDKNSINGIVNVVALGSSFLCGSFVPVMWLPDFVLKVAHIFPSYYFIQNNEILKKLQITQISDLSDVFINMGIMILFMILFIIVTNIISKRKMRID